MSGYRAPLQDIDFVLNHVVDLAKVAKLDGFQHADAETVKGVLEEAGRFFAEVIAPLQRIGDVQGSRLQSDGSVKTPDGFPEAYRKFVASGWPAAHLPEEWGGGGLPYTVGIAIQEMFKSANMAFSLCPMLTQSSIESLLAYGTDQQRRRYVAKLVEGTWTGTMCMTEPHAGSDVGALATRAERQADDSYRLYGQKIFITWGDHDLTDNVIHLVLARIPGAPPGTKGISMFIVPKYLVNEDGSLGARNDIKIVSLEHKLGIHASPTCVISFGDSGEGAVGYLIGDENAGMRYMFAMMNKARVGVGLEGLALTETSYQAALDFALDRQQGRKPGVSATEHWPIVRHPDVRRMLLTMKAYAEAMRCLLYTSAIEVDMEKYAETSEERARAGERVALLTPITKAWCTDLGVELTSIGLQVHGGMGYVEETGVAQLFRDSRIAPIYEGTNGIQAIDLVMRKLPMRGGAAVGEMIDQIAATADSLAGDADLGSIGSRLASATSVLRQATTNLLDRIAGGDPDEPLAAATPYLRMFGTVLGGWFMARSASEAARLMSAENADSVFLENKVTTARFYAEQLLPLAEGLLGAVLAPASALDLGVREPAP
jgi:3-(methylthio)propanoyl-CoA dehydrogenase